MVNKEVKDMIRKIYCPKCGNKLKSNNRFCAKYGKKVDKKGLVLASPWIRLLSAIIDDLILISVIFAFIGIFDYILLAPKLITIIGLFVIGWGYWIYFFGNGQTPGMLALKIKLCRTDGTYPIGYKWGFFRVVGMYLSTLILDLGYIWILVDKNNQGWHDKVADTYVVKA